VQLIFSLRINFKQKGAGVVGVLEILYLQLYLVAGVGYSVYNLYSGSIQKKDSKV
jgi:hypothetical protein